MTATVFAEYGTGLLHTVVQERDGGFVWNRSLGPDAPAPFVPIGRTVLPTPEIDGARLVTAKGDLRARIYEDVCGGESVAGLLLRGGPRADICGALRGVGALLAAAHRQSTPSQDEPRGFVRLLDWLAGRAATPRAASAERLLATGLGYEQLVRIIDWCAEVVHDSARVWSHGAAGLGSVVASVVDPGRVDLLVGEDVCGAPWYFDLGWIVGELIEMQWASGAGIDVWNQLLDALFEGYGRDLGERWNRIAVLRILLHLHDFTAYVAWSREEFSRYLDFIGFLIDIG